MSLSKQMILFISGMLMILLVGTFILNFNNTKTFLEHQLVSHSQDTATSLGLSLSSVANGEDTSSMETMINAVFDRGYYSMIALYDVDGKVIYKRTNSDSIQGIPNWFIHLIRIKAPMAESLVQTGWIPVGKLKVESHPGYAYIELWKTTISLTIWFVIAAVLAIALAIYALKVMLNPLKKLEQQAEAIVKKEYLLQEDLPNTTEFKQVVSAMNTMVHKMKDVFDRDAKMSEKLQKIAYQDNVTGLSNRLHFEMNIDSLIDPKSEALPGVMALVRIQNLKDINDQFGYPIGDKFVKLLSAKLIQHLNFKQMLNARLNGTELISVIPNSRTDIVIKQTENFLATAKDILAELNMAEEYLNVNIGIIHYEPGQTRGALLTNLDIAVTEAAQKGQNTYCYTANDEEKTDEQIWHDIIERAIKDSRFVLFQQGAYSAERQVHSNELLIRMKDDNGELQSAGFFMPTVIRLHRESEIDQLVAQLAANFITTSPQNVTSRLSINLSGATLESVSERLRLLELIDKHGHKHFAFEVAENLITNSDNQTRDFLKSLSKQGYEFGIDNFGSQFTKLAFLQDLRPDFIKLDMSFTNVIENDEQTRSYVSSVVDMCTSLDILVIAMGIENDAQRQAFESLGVTTFQGYLYGAPKPLFSPQ
ncbi:EAL domain-containing protein [Hydrogenovibrio sp. JE_KL2]|uniref:bifunctional diguanylate cyclase/phosphodiesterase n=1 Tax=Hydrogenovibrio sp. JE_KL2 TaxID=2651188 RepID=UPI00128B44AC|nr:EAL domain-containing protein [Hydrogenovibrio sp. JE_KL2]MPQ77348.1 EAL domain-containing protein [Hydrogenovibrio sp. JE_KL2]